MIANRKPVFVKDKQRESFLNVIHNRLERGKSSLIIGTYGCGKTGLLSQIKPRKRVAWVNAVQPVHLILPKVKFCDSDKSAFFVVKREKLFSF